MSMIQSERCLKCGKMISFTAEATTLLCPCGYSFRVMELACERMKLEKAQADSAEAKKKLEDMEAEKAELQSRLNGTLVALETIEDAQQAEDAKLDGILNTLKEDRQTHQAMTELLRTIKSEQADGQDALSQLLCAVMKKQSGAEDKLNAVSALAARILDAQTSGAAAREQMEDEILERIDALDLKVRERLHLSNQFYEWSRAVQEGDILRLQTLQRYSNELLQNQRGMNEKIEKLDNVISDLKTTVTAGFDKLEQQRMDTLIEMYHQAADLQIERKFDKAEELYRKLLVKGGPDTRDAEIYWRILLCHYGVEYQDENGKMIPIILRPDLSDPKKMGVRKELAEHLQNDEQKEYYLQRLDKIDFYLNRYREIRQDPQWKFDVFISVKQNHEERHTKDSDVASELYDFFSGRKLRVFNSRRTHLPVGEDYEPYIISALMSAKALIVVGSKADYMNSRWVKNEWSRFQFLQESDRKKNGKTERVLFCYLTGGMKPKDIPQALNPDHQALVDGPAAGEKLRELVKQMFPDQQSKPREAYTEHAGQEQVFEAMKTWLELGYFSWVTEKYMELLKAGKYMSDARLYLYALCAAHDCSDVNELAHAQIDLANDKLFKLACSHAHDDETKACLTQLRQGELKKKAEQEQQKQHEEEQELRRLRGRVVEIFAERVKQKARAEAQQKQLKQEEQERQRQLKQQYKEEQERQRLMARAAEALAERAKQKEKQAIAAKKPPETYEEYLAALENVVRLRSRELTMAEIDGFIQENHLRDKKIGRTEVQKDLDTIYGKLGIRLPQKVEAALKELVKEKGRLSEAQIEGFIRNNRWRCQGMTPALVKTALQRIYNAGQSSFSPRLGSYEEYLKALEDYVVSQKGQLDKQKVDAFVEFYHLREQNLTTEIVMKDLEKVYTRLGIEIPKAQETVPKEKEQVKENAGPFPQIPAFEKYNELFAPFFTNAHQDDEKYLIALENEVKERSRELTEDEIYEFIRKNFELVRTKSRAEIKNDIARICEKQKIKRTSTNDSAETFWRKRLNGINMLAQTSVQMDSKELSAAKKALGIRMEVNEPVLGLIHVNHGLFQGNTVLIITKERMYINTNDWRRHPPAEVKFKDIKFASTNLVSGDHPMYRMVLTMKNGKTLSFGSPATSQRDTLNFKALADAINQFIREFRL